MQFNTIKFLTIALAVTTVIGCGKPQGVTAEIPDIPAVQQKTAQTAAEDLDGLVTDHTAGMKIRIQDSKYVSVGEKVLSVSFSADAAVAGKSGNTVTMNWEGADDAPCPEVEHAPYASEFGILCASGKYSGTFTVTTSRFRYSLTKEVDLPSGITTAVTLDLARSLTQPVRKVGILGDSISTFKGELCNPEYSYFYPDMDPNVGDNPEIAVDCKEKTWWWRLIYDKMSHGELDVNNSWSGSKVIHQVKNGIVSGEPMNAGFVDRLDCFIDPDIILIHGGTNDNGWDSPMGTFDWDLPLDQLDKGTYCGAYIYTIRHLQERYEGVQLIIIVGDHLGAYATPTITIARHFGLPYVDFNGYGIKKCSGSHPTSDGFEKMASRIYDLCKDYLP